MWAGQRRGTDTHLRTIHDRNDEGEHEKGHGPGDVAVEVQDKDLQLIHLLQHLQYHVSVLNVGLL